MRSLYGQAYDCFRQGVDTGNDTAVKDMSELYYSVSCAASAANLFRFLKYFLELGNMTDCTSRSKLAAELMAIARDELANTTSLVERITPDETFYIWWHSKVKKITKDIFVRKIALMDSYCKQEAFGNWVEGKYDQFNEVQTAYNRYVEQMPMKPACNTVD